MKRFAGLCLLLALLTLVTGCSDHNSNSSLTTEPHPAGWVLSHPLQASQDLEGCQLCHGADFSGSGAAVSCFSCHIDGPPFGIHPASWAQDGAFLSHFSGDSFAAEFSWTSCAAAACHGTDLRGGSGSGETGPSCFSASFTSDSGEVFASCHATGPPPPGSHRGVNYSGPGFHGPDAKGVDGEGLGQVYCRNCHGRPSRTFDGGFVADPAILDRPGGNCSAAACHPAAKAHPTNWQGENDPDLNYLASHRTVNFDVIETGCALCHKTDAAGAGPEPGAPSCFSVSFTNADGSANSCHASGPAAHPLPFADPADHGPAAKNNLADCQRCHGTPGTTLFDGGIATTACSAAACHPAAGAHPSDWQGEGSFSHRTSGNQDQACVICHDVTEGRAAPKPASPSCFSATYTNTDGQARSCHPGGPGAPHPVPFLPPSLAITAHGAEAKQDLTVCQACHATPADGGAGSNPRFNLPRGNLGTGCEASGCHLENYAHPEVWRGPDATSHQTAGNQTVACALCHGLNLNGGVGPACSDCHTAGSPDINNRCISCHGNPPDGTIAPNIAGSHAVHNALPKVTGICDSCHNGQGSQTLNMFNGTVNLVFLSAYNARSGAASFDATAKTCSNVSCHGGQQTPDWETGSLNVNTGCSSCHEAAPVQFNSFRNDEDEQHNFHLGETDPFDGQLIFCTDCHNVTNLAINHFTNLDTPAMEGLAGGTVGGGGTRINSNGYDDGTNSCAPQCHGGETW